LIDAVSEFGENETEARRWREGEREGGQIKKREGAPEASIKRPIRWFFLAFGLFFFLSSASASP